MNRQQTVEHLRVSRPRILLLNQLHQRPNSGLPIIPRIPRVTPQPLPEPPAKPQLRLARNPLAVQIIVAIRIKQAVPHNSWRQIHALPQQRLQSACSPCVPARLNDVRFAQRRIELSRPPRQLRSHRQKIVRQQLDRIVLQIQSQSRKPRGRRYHTLINLVPSGASCRPGSPSPPRLPLHRLQRFVVSLFPLSLFR